MVSPSPNWKRILVVNAMVTASRDKLTFAIVDGREHVVDRTLADLDATLDKRRFVRIHRATIVNIAAVHKVDGSTAACSSG